VVRYRPIETYHLNTSKCAKSYKKGPSPKASIVSLLDETTGTVRTFRVKKGTTAEKVREILVTNVSRKGRLVTDKGRLYRPTNKHLSQETGNQTLSLMAKA
jgi:hypothetical protein